MTELFTLHLSDAYPEIINDLLEAIMKKKLLSVLLITALGASLLAGCSSEKDSVSDKTEKKVEEKLTKVTLNEVAHSIFYAPMYVAIEEDYFKDEGIDLELVTGLMVAQSKIEENKRQIEEMKPHAVLGKAITTANTSILVGDLAKILKQNGIEIGAKRLFQWMRENGYLIKRKGTDWNLPTQRSMEQNLFEIKESVHIDGNGCNRITRTPKITGKGQEYFVNKFLI